MKELVNLTLAVEAKALATLRTGIGQYVFGLYKAIAAKQNKPRVHYFIHHQFQQTLPTAVTRHNKTSKLKQRLIKRLNGLDNHLAYAKKMINTKVYNASFNRKLKTLNADAIHCTDFFCMGNKYGIPEFITVYDISCFRHPETHPAARVKLFHQRLPKSLAQARHIMTISEFSKSELINYFGVPAEKISVTYCGLPDKFSYIPPRQSAQTLSLYGLSHKQYLLYVGTIEPRKNLDILLEAYQALPERIKHHYPLVLIGALGWKFEQFMQKATPLLRAKQLVMPGYVPEQHLPQLMSGAFCFLYPSIYEGFGIPPLEAMASQVPVLAANTTSLPEVIGQAGGLLNPYDSEAWRDAIESLIDDSERYRNYVQQGQQQAALFTWEQCAEQTLACFRQHI